MSRSDWLALAELLLVFAAVMGWAGWQLWQVRRDQRAHDEREAARKPAQPPTDQPD